MEHETDPKIISTIKDLSRACEKHLQKLQDVEEAQETSVKAKHGYWAARQLVEYNLYHARMGIETRGIRSVEVRLKNVPEYYLLLKQLLQSLEWDLQELQVSIQSPGFTEPLIENIANSECHDDPSDDDSLSFPSLSSEGIPPRVTQDLKLKAHIEDTIGRLNAHAIWIELLRAKHCRQHVEKYQQMEDNKKIYEIIKKIAYKRIGDEFKSIPIPLRKRISEHLARRRIKFDYLREHQKESAAEIKVQEASPELTYRAEAQDFHTSAQISEKKTLAEENTVYQNPNIHDYKTVYSATENTKLEFIKTGPQKWAECVPSVVQRNLQFPSPPQPSMGKFHCPYCFLELDTEEAKTHQWALHVLEDLEPYFCLFEDCKTPFEVPNSFDGLLNHLQGHVPIRHHIYMPNGDRKELDEIDLESHIKKFSKASEAELSVIKESNQYSGPFMFEICPFCGSYPDVLRKKYDNPEIPDAQTELRKHINDHMQDIALYMLPSRDDISEDQDIDSIFSRHKTVGQTGPLSNKSSQTICYNPTCDCKAKFSHSFTEELRGAEVREEDLSLTDPGTDYWPSLLAGSGLYERSDVSAEDLESDDVLLPFVQRFKSEIARPQTIFSTMTDPPKLKRLLLADKEPCSDSIPTEAQTEIEFQAYLRRKSWPRSTRDRPKPHTKMFSAHIDEFKPEPRRKVLLLSENGRIVLGYHNENDDQVWACSGRGKDGGTDPYHISWSLKDIVVGDIPGCIEYLETLLGEGGTCGHSPLISRTSDPYPSIPACLCFFSQWSDPDRDVNEAIYYVDTENLCESCYKKAVPRGFNVWSTTYFDKYNQKIDEDYRLYFRKCHVNKQDPKTYDPDSKSFLRLYWPKCFSAKERKPILDPNEYPRMPGATIAHECWRWLVWNRSPFYIDQLCVYPPYTKHDNPEKRQEEEHRISKLNSSAYIGAAHGILGIPPGGNGKWATVELRILGKRVIHLPKDFGDPNALSFLGPGYIVHGDAYREPPAAKFSGRLKIDPDHSEMAIRQEVNDKKGALSRELPEEEEIVDELVTQTGRPLGPTMEEIEQTRQFPNRNLEEVLQKYEDLLSHLKERMSETTASVDKTPQSLQNLTAHQDMSIQAAIESLQPSDDSQSSIKQMSSGSSLEDLVFYRRFADIQIEPREHDPDDFRKGGRQSRLYCHDLSPYVYRGPFRIIEDEIEIQKWILRLQIHQQEVRLKIMQKILEDKKAKLEELNRSTPS